MVIQTPRRISKKFNQCILFSAARIIFCKCSLIEDNLDKTWTYSCWKLRCLYEDVIICFIHNYFYRCLPCHPRLWKQHYVNINIKQVQLQWVTHEELTPWSRQTDLIQRRQWWQHRGHCVPDVNKKCIRLHQSFYTPTTISLCVCALSKRNWECKYLTARTQWNTFSAVIQFDCSINMSRLPTPPQLCLSDDTISNPNLSVQGCAYMHGGSQTGRTPGIKAKP